MADPDAEKLEADFTALQDVEDKIREINDELEDEMVKLDKEYTRKKQPLFDERSKICAEIPNFWLNALLNHPDLQQYITTDDYALLRHLTSVEVKDVDEPETTGTRYVFTFKKNPFFDHTEVFKEFKYDKETGQLDVKGTAIVWKDGQDLTRKKTGKDPAVGSKRGGAAEEGAEDEEEDEDENPSFFVWFDEDELSETPVGEWIREDIWKNPFSYYCGEGANEDEDDDDDEGASDDEEAEEFENEDDEGEEEEEGEEGGDDAEGA